MAKTIKFNLICDGYPARTIEDLQNHFCVDDLLAAFENGLLVRWLDVRGYNEELQDIRMIRDRDPLIIIEKLIKIFHIEEDETEIKNAILALKLQRKRKETVSSYTKEKFDHAINSSGLELSRAVALTIMYSFEKLYDDEERLEFQRDFEDDVIEEGNKNGWYVDYEED